MKYVVNAGQDCSTFLLMEYSGLSQRQFFFDRLVIYSDDWVKAFTNSFIDQKENIQVSVFLKQTTSEIHKIYLDCVEHGYESQRRRMVFHGRIGDRYNTIYFDVRHIDDKQLKPLLDFTSFEAFYRSIESNVIPKIEDIVRQNLKNAHTLYTKHRNEELVFIRTIKHPMSEIEHKHIVKMRDKITKMFPNSKFLVFSDVKENSGKEDGIIFFQFDHWKRNSKDKENFIKLLKGGKYI